MSAGTLRIAEIWRYPVKSMAGERIEAADGGSRGIPLDRGWAVRDEQAGAIRSARYIPRLLLCSARYLPGTDAGLVPHVEITLPDGSTVRSDDRNVDQRLSDAIGRRLTLWSLKPADEIEHLRVGPEALVTGDATREMRMLFGLNDDEPLPDLSGVPPKLLRELGELAAPRGTYFDAFPVNVLTEASLRYLQTLLPESKLDVRRFRPNILIANDSAPAKPVEFDWIGREVTLGAARIAAVMRCPRCIMTTRAQEGSGLNLPRDSAIMRTLVRETEQNLSIYCTVSREGRIAVGDPVSIN